MVSITRTFRFSWKVTLVCGVLILLMVRASVWQYDRWQQKLSYIELLKERFKQPVTSIGDLLSEMSSDPTSLLHRRASISCTFDYQYEMLLSNRRYQGIPGVFLLTPCSFSHKGAPYWVIINRGFIPSRDKSPEKRRIFQTEERRALNAQVLLKESVPRKFLSPADPPSGPGFPWVDQWLRVNLPAIQKQLPYQILPMWAEIIALESDIPVEQRLTAVSTAGREEMLFLPGGDSKQILSDQDIPNLPFPIPLHDTVVPAGRHKEYVYEWIALAVLTLLIGLVLQLKRPATITRA